MDARDNAAVDWLLASAEPAVRMLTRRDVLGEPSDGDVLEGAWVRALLSGQQSDGGFGVHWYRKWTGAHWRLVQLIELGVPAGELRALAALDSVLDRLTGPRQVTVIDGLARVCASIEGNALAVACRLGDTGDPRVRRLVEWLLEWQWPDGGWNCDKQATGRRSSFHETLPTALGLQEYAAATGDPDAAEAARRAAELFLEHRLFRSLQTGEVVDPKWLRLCYPPYWHYDVLQVLLVLSRMGLAGDPRADEALDHLESRRHADARWRANQQWWKPGGGPITPEVVDWGRAGEPNLMITLNAMRVRKAAGRLHAEAVATDG
jgi:hypothetical protein